MESSIVKKRFALLVQFTDQICETWMVDEKENVGHFKTISEPREMNRLLMVRGNNDKVYFIETHKRSEKIVEVEVKSDQPQELSRKIVYDIYGSPVISFATDCLNFEDDRFKKCSQSMYVLDMSGRISYLSNSQEGTFSI